MRENVERNEEKREDAKKVLLTRAINGTLKKMTKNGMSTRG